ncbi:nitrite reductase (NAD(P)H) small subunit [Xylanibacillus composti]|uniref:Assimilatory nitrite reductase [NAD(P)H] small subunit n=1 Tax=Xylanibacillus composti TaxID=1572762 RepID=A0A8J4H3C3_9BACL|nr:nitrite reductase small subunit NirD [Xylanibacillus composti]MDT9726064.1 nitrite reductase (NAD(P)H) small subunit [Xylanibacillus composti]GIQ68791.1 assimilatory nitrite reductase [NAD(P)H] small subunit [Xylanibacillus composti]
MNQVAIGNYSDIEEKRSRIVQINGIEISVFKLSSGEIRAIENRCPHKGGKLSEGIVSGHYVFCPLHDWKIDMNDGVVQAPDEGCVATYQVTVTENGELLLDLESATSDQSCEAS